MKHRDATKACLVSPESDDNTAPMPKPRRIDGLGLALLAVIVLITVLTYPSFDIREKPTAHEVFYYGWITAVSTGLGVVPFLIFEEPNKFYMGVSNAIAGGMMIAASLSLVLEALEPVEGGDGVFGLPPVYRAAIGVGLGVLFILGTKRFLDQYEHLKLGEIQGVSAQRMILIIFVMTLHSLTEGIGIGVSFGGSGGQKLGRFISLSLAVHNVPEGLAVVLVLTARKVSKLRSALWAMMTSMPQPLMAIPAFLFVEKFLLLLPTGLGFAAGAMTYVAVFELLAEAVEDCSYTVTAVSGKHFPPCIVVILLTMLAFMSVQVS